MKRIMLTLLASIVASAVLSPLAVAKKQPTNDQAVAAITQFENDAVKANLAGDSSFVEKNYADDWSGGFSGGIWTTKKSVLADTKDSANNKMNSEQISDLKVRIYDTIPRSRPIPILTMEGSGAHNASRPYLIPILAHSRR